MNTTAELKQRTIKDWQDHYASPSNFARVFSDRAALEDKSRYRSLSSSERNQYLVLNYLIDD